jgi:hypothetical protein
MTGVMGSLMVIVRIFEQNAVAGIPTQKTETSSNKRIKFVNVRAMSAPLNN